MFLNLRFCFCSEELVGLGRHRRDRQQVPVQKSSEKSSLLNDSFGEEQTDFFRL